MTWAFILLVNCFVQSAHSPTSSHVTNPKKIAIDQVTPRKPANDDELRDWLINMAVYHRFTDAEITRATGLSDTEIGLALARFKIDRNSAPMRQHQRMLVLPYPGGRHPRIGFLDGAIDPQRETKFSIFCPWDAHSYVVADVPEAIWSNLGLTYLAHTHVPTVWDKQGKALPIQEWTRKANGRLESERTLPNGIKFRVIVKPTAKALRMEMSLTNGTDQPLTDLRVQQCFMLKMCEGFAQQTNDNKKFVKPYAVAHDIDRKRWIIAGWSPIQRVWGNAPCPCLHADPQFPDCPPGETKTIRGWFSFYQGSDIDAELNRLSQLNWMNTAIDTELKSD